MIVVTVLTLNVFGDGVRDALDPRGSRALRPRRITGECAVIAFVDPPARFDGASCLRSACSSFLIFFAIPGIDPARQMAGRNPTPATIHAIRHEFGLDRPLPVQYVLLMNHLCHRRDLVSLLEPRRRGGARDRAARRR